jgi:RNA polymerase-binding transcription factor DksA
MADEADVGNDYAEKVLAMRLNARVRYEGESAEECITCGEKIAQARRLAVKGCVRCTACEDVMELMGRARRG